MDNSQIFLGIIFVLMCAIAVGVTISDKQRAIHRKRRISEQNLLIVGAFTSATAMYVTMRIIKHKTRNNKFMLGLPLLIAVKIAFFLFIFIKLP